MTLPESDELLILAYEALENRARFDKKLPDFPLFRSEWSAVHIESHGSHILSFWRGPGTEMMVLLTQGQPPERTLAAVDHRPCARKPRIEPTEGSFLLPGVPFGSPRGSISSFGIFAGWWPCETDAKRLRLTRRGKVSEIEAGSNGFMLVDWNSPAAVERFDAVEIGKTGWTPTVVPAVPFTGDHLFRSYQRFRLSGVDWGDENPDLWAYDLFSIQGKAWLDAVVAIMRRADPHHDADMLASFGAHIYANGDAYYDRMERELNAGTIQRETLGIVLSMEKPEFMEADLRERHKRLAARCG